jgi:hypothetical protein
MYDVGPTKKLIFSKNKNTPHYLQSLLYVRIFREIYRLKQKFPEWIESSLLDFDTSCLDCSSDFTAQTNQIPFHLQLGQQLSCRTGE